MSFKDASQLLDEDPEACFLWHAVRFRWDGFVPRFTGLDNRSHQLSELGLDRWDWFISETRRCAGSWKDDIHVPCPSSRTVGRFSSCRECHSFPVQECVFEPRCHGEQCPDSVCGEEHAVYISFLGTEPKVGMTRADRVRSRGVEQGADAILPVLFLPDRKEARSKEKELATAMGVRQTVPASDFARSLTRPPPYDDIAAMAEKLLRNNDLDDGGLMILDSYPMPALDEPPVPVPVPGRHRGDVIGCKGRFMVYRDTKGPARMIDMTDVVGRFLGTAPCRCVQTTLF